MKVKIGDFTVENFGTPYMVAEIGANHNGDMDLAKKMIDAAVDSGCNAAKFQSWSTKSLLSKSLLDAGKEEEFSDFGVVGLENIIDLMAISEDQHKELADYCKKHGIDFISSVFCNEEIDLIQSVGAAAIKIASMDLNNLDLISYAANTGLPVLLSTGMGTIGEIEQAVESVNKIGKDNLILLHCVSNYPPEYDEINLRNIAMLREMFNIPIGFSDHSIDPSIAMAAVAQGACVIEKHFTLDRAMPGWDHAISILPDEMATLIESSNRIQRALGSYSRVLGKRELEKRLSFRRSIVAERTIEKGETITRKHISLKRPGTGLAPSMVEFVVGREAKKRIKEGQVITADDI